MMKLFFGILIRLGIVLLVSFILTKLGVFKYLSKVLGFINTETKKNFQNKERILKLKKQLKRNIRRCDEL